MTKRRYEAMRCCPLSGFVARGSRKVPPVVHEGREVSGHSVASDLPAELQWNVRSLSSITSSIDTMLDTEPCTALGIAGWVTGFQEFAAFMADNRPDQG